MTIETCNYALFILQMILLMLTARMIRALRKDQRALRRNLDAVVYGRAWNELDKEFHG
jgi:hypothetical protein